MQMALVATLAVALFSAAAVTPALAGYTVPVSKRRHGVCHICSCSPDTSAARRRTCDATSALWLAFQDQITDVDILNFALNLE